MSPFRREAVWYTGGTRAEDRATLESDLSADTRPKPGQRELHRKMRLCSLVSALVLAQSEKLKAAPGDEVATRKAITGAPGAGRLAGLCRSAARDGPELVYAC